MIQQERSRKACSRGIAVVMTVVLAFLGVPVLPAQAVADDTSLVAADIGEALSPADAGAEMSAQAAGYDISWYEGKSSPYTISNILQLKGLAYLVNEGVHDFSGEVVQLPDSVTTIFAFSGGASIAPIGTPDHPFEGTFDGKGRSIANLTLDAGGSLSHIGLFGYAGENATIKNVKLQGGAVTVTNEEDGKTITDIGALAGYLGGDLQNCYSSVAVSVANNGAVPDIEGTTAEELCIITNVGGLVGFLNGSMSDCEHADAVLTIASTSDVSTGVPYIAGYVGGLVGHQGDESDALESVTTSNCVNSGKISFSVTGMGGVDRFGAQMYSKSSMVGGIVGYTMGSVLDCTNEAEIQTGVVEDGAMQAGWGSSNVGGIVGSQRGPTIADSASATGITGSNDTDPGYTAWTNSQGDPACAEALAITIERCANTADITGLASVGGIAGSTGVFTQTIGCSNVAKIEGTRWNKPCPAGIVGISNGDIVYCYNRGRCVSTTGGGYYASGITALLTTYNTSITADELVTPVPELYGCYITGMIGGSDTGYRTAVIAGENDGYIHDNCFLPNLTVDKAVDEDGFDDGELHSRLVTPGENRGTLANNHELSVQEMKSGLAVSYLNLPTATDNDWSVYYAPVQSAFPVLSWQSEGSEDTTDLATVVSGIGTITNPCYSASVAPIPTVELVTSDGSVLYQNCDYRVVVDDDAMTVGTSYDASIIGFNGYSGTLSAKARYTIAKADIGTCTVSAAPLVFNWEQQSPKSITLIDSAGNAVDTSEYTFRTLANDDGNTASVDGKYYDYINVHGEGYRYDIEVTASPESVHYEGSTTQAAFQIKWASLMNSVEESSDPNQEESAKLGDVVYGDETWSITDALKTKGFVKIKYTGGEIKPTCETVTYLGRELRDGTGKPYYYTPLEYDFLYVYGNPNPETVPAQSGQCTDVTGSDESALACMTVRFTPGGNFKNYTNVFYEITPASIADDVSITGIKSSYQYAGEPVTISPTLTYNGMTLEEGVDYEITYEGNTVAGTAYATITGKGNYDGSVTESFAIKAADISGATIEPVANVVYSGAAQEPALVVKLDGKRLTAGVDYEVAYSNNVNVGTASAVVEGVGGYEGTVAPVSFAITKAKQPVAASNATVSFAYAKLKASAKKVNIAKACSVSAPGTLTYAGTVNKAAAKISVTKKGVIKIKKGLAKGTYKVKVTAHAAATKNYKATDKNFIVKIKVK